MLSTSAMASGDIPLSVGLNGTAVILVTSAACASRVRGSRRRVGLCRSTIPFGVPRYRCWASNSLASHTDMWG